MSDFIIQNQSSSNTKEEQLQKTASGTNLKVFVKPLVVFALCVGLIVLSVLNERLFLEELIVATSIIGLVSVIYLLSERKDQA